MNRRGCILSHRDLGLVTEVFTEDALSKLGTGTMAMGHVRYDVEPPENGQPVRLVYVTTSSSYDHSWHSIPHTHSNAEIFYCINGEGRFMVGDDRFTVKTDDLVVVNARQRHTEFSLEKTHLEYIVQNSVSLVGRTAMRSVNCSPPPIVTHATSGAKPST